MSKDKDKIGVTINKDVNDNLEKECVNKSKLINFLLSEWLKDKKNVYNFITPNNKNIIVNNLKEFYNNNNLKINMMYNLISGVSKVSKSGWKYKQ